MYQPYSASPIWRYIGIPNKCLTFYLLGWDATFGSCVLLPVGNNIPLQSSMLAVIFGFSLKVVNSLCSLRKLQSLMLSTSAMFSPCLTMPRCPAWTWHHGMVPEVPAAFPFHIWGLCHAFMELFRWPVRPVLGASNMPLEGLERCFSLSSYIALAESQI